MTSHRNSGRCTPKMKQVLFICALKLALFNKVQGQNYVNENAAGIPVTLIDHRNTNSAYQAFATSSSGDVFLIPSPSSSDSSNFMQFDNMGQNSENPAVISVRQVTNPQVTSALGRQLDYRGIIIQPQSQSRPYILKPEVTEGPSHQYAEQVQKSHDSGRGSVHEEAPPSSIAQQPAADVPLQLPKERISVTSFPSMRAAKHSFGNQMIAVDAKKLNKEVDNIEWREEIIFPRQGPSRVNWNPSGYVEDSRITKARNNRLLYAEFKESSEEEPKPTNKYLPRQTPHESYRASLGPLKKNAEIRAVKSQFPSSQEQEEKDYRRAATLEQQPFRISEEEKLRSQFGYSGKKHARQPEVQYYTKHPNSQTVSNLNQPVSTEINSEGNPDHQPAYQITREQYSSEEKISEHGVDYIRPKRYQRQQRITKEHGSEEGDGIVIQRQRFDDQNDSAHHSDSHEVYEQGHRGNKPHNAFVESDQDHSALKHSARTTHVQRDHSHQQHSDPHEGPVTYVGHAKVNRYKSLARDEYKPSFSYGHDRRQVFTESYKSQPQNVYAHQENVQSVRTPRGRYSEYDYSGTPHEKQYLSRRPNKIIQQRKRHHHHDDDEDEADEEKTVKRFNIRFENNPGEEFSFRKNNRKGYYSQDDEPEPESDNQAGLRIPFLQEVSQGSENTGGLNFNIKLG